MSPDSYGNADYAHAGSIEIPELTGIAFSRPKPRAALYALGEAASKTIGGSTSRRRCRPLDSDHAHGLVLLNLSSGLLQRRARSAVDLADVSTSATTARCARSSRRRRTSTISSTAMRVPNVQALYTPAIPTPREGYAVEGKAGPIGFATFDSIGDGRTDLASAVDYTSPDTRWGASVERVAANLTGLNDYVTESGLSLLRPQAHERVFQLRRRYRHERARGKPGAVLRFRRRLVESDVRPLRLDAQDRPILQSGRRFHLAPRHRRLRALHGQDLRLHRRQQAGLDRRRGIHGSLSRPDDGHRAERQPVHRRHPDEARARSAALHRLELLALRRPS